MKSSNLTHSKDGGTRYPVFDKNENGPGTEDGVIINASKNRDTNCQVEDRETTITLHQGLDGGYSWVILLCVVILQITTVGTTLTSGLLVVEFREAF